MTVSEQFAQAARLHEAGRLKEAQEAYRRLLEVAPNHPDVLHMLGLTFLQIGQPAVAVEFLTRAINARPQTADFHSNLAVALDRLDRTPEAIARYRAALALAPADAVVLCNLSDALRRQGELGEAITLAQRAVGAQPTYYDAHHHLAKAHVAAGDIEKAIHSYRTTLSLKPDLAEAFNGLGDCLRRVGRNDESIEQFTRAIVAQGDFARAHSNLGAALLEVGRLEEAAASIRRAIEIEPSLPEAHTNLGNYYLAMGDNHDALAEYERAVELRPNYGLAHHQVAWTLLLKGDYERGWREYEWRLQVAEFRIPRRDYPQPRWNGEGLAGKSILLYGEQGCGDRIQFARYVPLVAAQAAKTFLTCRPDLMRLYKTLGADIELLHPEQPLPQFDVHCSLASLPLRFGTTLETIPSSVPYLRANHELALQWKTRVSEFGDKRKIGLAWSGSAKHKNDRYRSMTLSTLAPLAKIPGAVFFSLQKGAGSEQAAAPPPGMQLIDWSGELHDFADTAALIDALDCVITVDTSVAHLAGAMGKPAYLLLPMACDWRWLEQRGDSPWYPTLRLFRQKSLGHWSAPLDDLIRILNP